MTYTLSMYERDQEALPGGPADPTLDAPQPIPAAWQDNYSGAWHDGDTGKIITAAKAAELRGMHADKCECQNCTDENDGDDWRDEE